MSSVDTKLDKLVEWRNFNFSYKWLVLILVTGFFASSWSNYIMRDEYTSAATTKIVIISIVALIVIIWIFKSD